jgi:hypothetical protein
MQSKIGAGGVGESSLGIIYQSKLIEWFAYKGQELKIPFQILTELEGAGKFDDLIFRNRDQCGATKHRLIQAKQKAKAHEMSMDFLVKDKKYTFYKYFESFLGMEGTYKYEEIDDLIFVTNNQFPACDSENIITLKAPYGGSMKLEVLVLDDPIFETYGCRVKFPVNRYIEENSNFLKSWFLDEEIFGLFTKEIKSPNKFPILRNLDQGEIFRAGRVHATRENQSGDLEAQQ